MRYLAALTAVFLVGCRVTEPAAPIDARIGRVAPVPEPIAEAEEPAAFAPDALRPCASDVDADAARAALATIDAHVTALDDGPRAPVRPIVDALRALLLTPCFELAAADLPDELEFDSGIALKTWWSDGGEAALRSYLQGEAQLDTAVTPATPRPSYFLDGNESSVLAPLLCAANDPKCGRGAAAGWYVRAEALFERRAEGRDGERDGCAEQAKRSPPVERWSAFRDCRLERTPLRAAMPLGRFQAPSDGLLAVASGDYACWQLDVYDLATGAAYRTGCRGATEVGRVSISALRETVWMLALSSVASDTHRPADSMSVPPAIVTARPRAGARAESFGVGGLYLSSHRQEWTWLRTEAGGSLAGQMSGEVMRGPSLTANEHASSLLDVTNATFVEGCAPALRRATRGAVDWSRPGRRAYHPDEDPPFDFDNPDLDAARAAFAATPMPPVCASMP